MRTFCVVSLLLAALTILREVLHTFFFIEDFRRVVCYVWKAVSTYLHYQEQNSWMKEYCRAGYITTLYRKICSIKAISSMFCNGPAQTKTTDNLLIASFIVLAVCAASSIIIQIMDALNEFIQNKRAVHKHAQVENNIYQERLQELQENRDLKFYREAQQFIEVPQEKDCAWCRQFERRMEAVDESPYFRGTEVVPNRPRSVSPTKSVRLHPLHLRESSFEPRQASARNESKKGRGPQKRSDTKYKQVSPVSSIGSAHSSWKGSYLTSVKAVPKEKFKVQLKNFQEKSNKEKVQTPGKTPHKKSNIENKGVSPASSIRSAHNPSQSKGYLSSVKKEPKKEKCKAQLIKFQNDLGHQRQVQLPCEAQPKMIQDLSGKSCGMRLGTFQKPSPYFYEAYMFSE